MNSASPRVIMVGCGGIARAHLSAIDSDCVVALCDSNLAIAQRLKDEFNLNAPIFASLPSAWKTRPDIAVLCTPPSTHFDLAKLALNAGVHVLCEKPLCTNSADANALVELAQSRALTLRTSAKYRFDAGVRAAKTLLQSGEAGALRNLKIAFGAPFDWERSWHGNPILSGGGVWMDNGPHALDLARFFAGELEFQALKSWRKAGDLETEIEVELRAPDDVKIEIALSWQRALGERFAVLGCENGTLEVGWRQTTWNPRDGQVRVLAGAYDKRACFAAQWRGFIGDDVRWNVEDGARVVELLEAVYRNAR